LCGTVIDSGDMRSYFFGMKLGEDVKFVQCKWLGIIGMDEGTYFPAPREQLWSIVNTDYAEEL
jgi:hypothetical protein